MHVTEEPSHLPILSEEDESALKIHHQALNKHFLKIKAETECIARYQN